MFGRKNVPVQRKAILMSKDIEVKREKEDKSCIIPNVMRRKVVALVGTHNGSGCTHLTLALAYKLSYKYNVALVELDKKGDLKGFDMVYELKPGRLGSKKLGKLDLYYYEQNNLIDVLKEGYDYIFLDIGKGIYTNEIGQLKACEFLNEAYRADIKCLVTQTKEWQQKYLADFIKYDGTMNDWIILANMSTKDEVRELRASIKGLTSQVERVPHLENVFDVTGKEFEELVSILSV